MTRALLYLRVSTEDQAERFSLDAQEAALRRLAASRGYAVVAPAVRDDGYSGATLERPGLAALRAAVQAGGADVVLVTEPDRLSRDVRHALDLVAELAGVGVGLESLSGPIAPTAHGRFAFTVQTAAGTLERELGQERAARSRLDKAARGLRVSGRPPYGYRIDPEARARVVVAPEEARTVLQVYRAYGEEGLSVYAVVRRLTAEGVPPPRAARWHLSTVHRMLATAVYTGTWYYNRRRRQRLGRGRTQWGRHPEAAWIALPVPPLVPPVLAAQVAARRAANRDRLVGRPPALPAVLRGLARCGRCGYRLTLTTVHAARGRTHRYYRCDRREPIRAVGAPCATRPLRADVLEASVWEAVVAALRQPEMLARQAEAARLSLGVRDVEVRSEVAQLTQARQALGVTLQRALDLALDPTLPQAAIRTRLRALEGERADLDARLAAARARVLAHEAEAGRLAAVRAFVATLEARLDARGQTPEGQRAVLLQVVEAVVCGPAGVDVQLAVPLAAPAEAPTESSPTAGSRGPARS